MVMKKRKLKKLIKESVKEAQYDLSPKRSVSDKDLSRNDYNYTDASEDTKSKVRNLIIRLAKKRDSIDFNITEYAISFYSKSHNTKSQYFNIDILKDVGFNITYNDNRVYLKDIKLYDEMLDKIKKEFDEINLSNFTELYNGLMKENGLSRESNLDELLSSI
jgi:hypothetical protein